MSTVAIPCCLNLSEAREPTWASFLKNLLEALMSDGIFYIKNFGVASKPIKEVHEQILYIFRPPSRPEFED
jgi:isopenicillin N synthase-like dioxygenase